MPVEHSGAGDPARSIELLWGSRSRGERGPRPGLSVERITAAAIELADAEGVEALSMRRVAEHLGSGTMTLYRYVPGKAELLDLMVDRVSGEAVQDRPPGKGWRERLELVARTNRELYERHPWLLRAFPLRPPLGPGIIAKYDFELRAVEGIGLSDVEMDSVLTLVLEHVYAAAAARQGAARTPARTGRTDEQWWAEAAPALEKVLAPERYPVATRVGSAAAEHYRGLVDPEHFFAFGLERLLDGVEVFIERARGG